MLGQLAINKMALPPILKFGSKEMKDLVCRDVIEGRTYLSLGTLEIQKLSECNFFYDSYFHFLTFFSWHAAISEPGAGSDVANIQTTAVKGKHPTTGEEVTSDKQ